MQEGPTQYKRSRGKLKHMKVEAPSCRLKQSLPIWLALEVVAVKDLLPQCKELVC